MGTCADQCLTTARPTPTRTFKPRNSVTAVIPRATTTISAVIRHEQHAEMVLFAYATFGSPSYQTFLNAVKRGWLHNYPNLTPDMVRRNKPHVPAYALGHIQASRSGVRSTPPHQTAEEVLKNNQSDGGLVTPACMYYGVLRNTRVIPAFFERYLQGVTCTLGARA